MKTFPAKLLIGNGRAWSKHANPRRRVNVAHFDGYNLALRIHHAGYTNVYWYRGGREAWEVAGKPEDVVRPADW